MIYFFFSSLAAVVVKSSRLVFLLVMLEFFVLSLISLGVMNLDFIMYFFLLWLWALFQVWQVYLFC